MKSQKYLFPIFCFFASFTQLFALSLNGLFTDNMVIQRDQTVPIWGYAEPGSKITVDFSGRSVSASADENGAWNLLLPKMRADAEPQTLTVSQEGSAMTLSIENILIGDVWLCAGQSNMAWKMSQLRIWNHVKDNMQNDKIRLFKIKHAGVGSPNPSKVLVIDEEFKDSWQPLSPQFAQHFSATATFFAQKLQPELDVPIGLLYANRGGTKVNMWLPRNVLEERDIYEEYLSKENKFWKATKQNPESIKAPSHLFNGTIHPLIPFAIKGTIWYQGESDASRHQDYQTMFSDLITSWRNLWGYEFPFLFVQLAPFGNVHKDKTGEQWAFLREAQTRTAESLKGVEMVVITDAGELKNIHPQDKKTVGERLAMKAADLKNWRKRAQNPSFSKMRIKGDSMYLKFDDVSGGLKSKKVTMNTNPRFLPGEDPDAVTTKGLNGFSIAGPDGTFVKAQAEIIGRSTVRVFAPGVIQPTHVRYGWANFPLCNLYGGNGLPAIPFRTDSFENK